MMTRPFEVALIGAGNRGLDVYAAWVLQHPGALRVTAVAEPDPMRRSRAAALHGIPADRQFDGWETLLAQPRLADAAIVATQDQHHTAPALAALAAGYDVLLEKPMAHRLDEAAALVLAAERSGRLLQICHVLRYTDFFQAVHRIVQSGRLGQIVTVSHRENVSSWHMAHSYVRGNWRREAAASPMILAKSSHDMDILYWVLGQPVESLSSVGNLLHFRPDNAPPGAPDRCLDGCPAADTCPFYAPALYLDLNPIHHALTQARSPLFRTAGWLAQNAPGVLRAAAKVIPPLRELAEYRGWPRSVITDQPADPAAILDALRTGPYGRCVYRTDNDVVDHQVVAMKLAGGQSATFTMHGHSFEEGRTLRIDGSQATLLGKFGHDKAWLEVRDHRTFEAERIDYPNAVEASGHGGGDDGLMRAFVHALEHRDAAPLTTARASLEGHLMAFAAEEARVTGKVVDMAAFRAEAEAQGRAKLDALAQ